MQLAYGGVFDYHGSASTGMVGYSAAREMRRTEYRLGMTLVPLRGVSGCGDCPSHVVVPPAGPSGVLLGTGGGGLFGWEMRRGLLGSPWDSFLPFHHRQASLFRGFGRSWCLGALPWEPCLFLSCQCLALCALTHRNMVYGSSFALSRSHPPS